MTKFNIKKLNDWLISTNAPENYSHFHDLHIDEVVKELQRTQWIALSFELLNEANRLMNKDGFKAKKNIFLAVPLKESRKFKYLDEINTTELKSNLNEYTSPSLYMVTMKGEIGTKINFKGKLPYIMECYYSQFDPKDSSGLISRTVWFQTKENK